MKQIYKILIFEISLIQLKYSENKQTTEYKQTNKQKSIH